VNNFRNPAGFDAHFGQYTSFANWDWEEVLTSQFERYPLMQVQDLYKLIYQAAKGAEHLINDQVRFREAFLKEWNATATDDEIPLLETIAPGGSVMRIHFAACRSAGINADTIYEKVLASTEGFTGDPQRVNVYWETARSLAEKFNWFPAGCMGEFLQNMHEKYLSVVRHSAVFKNTYQPHYRLIRAEVLNNSTQPEIKTD